MGHTARARLCHGVHAPPYLTSPTPPAHHHTYHTTTHPTRLPRAAFSHPQHSWVERYHTFACRRYLSHSLRTSPPRPDCADPALAWFTRCTSTRRGAPLGSHHGGTCTCRYCWTTVSRATIRAGWTGGRFARCCGDVPGGPGAGLRTYPPGTPGGRSPCPGTLFTYETTTYLPTATPTLHTPTAHRARTHRAHAPHTTPRHHTTPGSLADTLQLPLPTHCPCTPTTPHTAPCRTDMRYGSGLRHAGWLAPQPTETTFERPGDIRDAYDATRDLPVRALRSRRRT